MATKRATRPRPTFAARLLDWAADHGRQGLPWQHDRTPYRVWVSEIMLQQTQVATVIGYYERFMERFPDVDTLAAANPDEVLHLWSGLGYYSRARNLHKASRQIMEQHAGIFPSTIDEVEALPGIGRSTAGAILSLALDQHHPILDGNVKRVLCRHKGIEGWPGNASRTKALWTVATDLTPSAHTGAYTQAIMDLGATVCVRSRPSCLLCPVAEDCVARVEGKADLLPSPRPKRDRPLRHSTVVVVRDGKARIWLEQRPPAGIWGGLWGFPEIGDDPACDETEQVVAWCLDKFGAAPESISKLATIRHGFTHFE
ncbi:MAG: A/G-specific adenine glycosylase, partial [Chromatiales bacterium]|nr:A/G-specific adenine glycosylase [Chromatiales bacterium]